MINNSLKDISQGIISFRNFKSFLINYLFSIYCISIKCSYFLRSYIRIVYRHIVYLMRVTNILLLSRNINFLWTSPSCFHSCVASNNCPMHSLILRQSGSVALISKLSKSWAHLPYISCLIHLLVLI